MRCPRCGNEWDAQKGSCTVCGLTIGVLNQRPVQNTFNASSRDMSPQDFLKTEQLIDEPVPLRQLPHSDLHRDVLERSNGSSQFPLSSQPDSPHVRFKTSGPLTPVPPSRSMEPPHVRHTSPNSSGEQRTPRPFHLTTPATSDDVSPILDTQFARTSSASSGQLQSSQSISTLEPGALLRRGRYRLQQMQGRRYWLPDMYEANWIAQDVQRASSQLVMRELMLPEHVVPALRPALQAATMSFASVGRNAHLPTLIDAFSEYGRYFFVFTPIEGELLQSRMTRTGRPLTETEVIEMCLQMTDALDLLSQQSPPLVHGLISPKSIVIGRKGNEYVLTGFSIVLSSGATRFIAGIDRNKPSPYAAPETSRGLIDVRSDMYSLLATAYYAVTGSTPAMINGSISPAQRANSSISPQLNALLAKGLRSTVNQRYQSPSELRRELLMVRHGENTVFRTPDVAGNQEAVVPLAQRNPTEKQYIGATSGSSSADETVAQIFQSLVPDDELDRYKTLLPRPEELPPIPEQDYTMQANIWIIAIVVCLLVLVILGRGLI